MNPELCFDDWLSQTQEERDALSSYGNSEIVETDEAIQKSSDCGRLQRQAEFYVTAHTAQHTLHSKEKYPQLSAEARRVMVKDSVKHIQFIAAAIAVYIS